MIHAIELENFKGVGPRTRLELAPVTLLFGANNAGKSSVLQALLYVLEVLRRGTPDIRKTHLGGDAVDLGGFDRLVHGHDPRQTLSIRVEFSTPSSLNCFDRELTVFPFPDLDDEVGGAWVELRGGRFYDGDQKLVHPAAFAKEVLIGTAASDVGLTRFCGHEQSTRRGVEHGGEIEGFGGEGRAWARAPVHGGVPA